VGRARVESGEKDAESSKSDAKRSNIEVKSVRPFVVCMICSGRLRRESWGLCLGGGLEEDLSSNLIYG
jgi:hypothetical protein